MRGAWKISEVKDLAGAEGQVHRDHHPGQGAVRRRRCRDWSRKRPSGSASKRPSPSSSIARRTSDESVLRNDKSGAAVESAALFVSGGCRGLARNFSIGSSRCWRRSCAWCCIVLTIALFIIVVVAIVARYGFGQAVSWTEEVPRYLLIWISFLAAAVGVLRREHVGFDVLFNALPKRVRRALGVFLGLLIFGFGWVVFRYGIVFVQDFGGDLMETIPYTNYWYYPAMPISRLPDDGVRLQAHHRRDRASRKPAPSPACETVDWRIAHDSPRPRPRLHHSDRTRPADFVRGRRRDRPWHVSAAGRRQRHDRSAHADLDQHVPVARRHLLRVRRRADGARRHRAASRADGGGAGRLACRAASRRSSASPRCSSAASPARRSPKSPPSAR